MVGVGRGRRDPGPDPTAEGTSRPPTPCVSLAGSLRVRDLGLLICKMRTQTLQPPGCWENDLRSRTLPGPRGLAVMESPPGCWGREGAISGSGQVSILLGARGEGTGQQGRGPSQEAPIPSHTLGRGPESQRWQSALGHRAWGAETHVEAADQHLYSRSTAVQLGGIHVKYPTHTQHGRLHLHPIAMPLRPHTLTGVHHAAMPFKRTASSSPSPL